jgi:hypothetical protein
MTRYVTTGRWIDLPSGQSVEFDFPVAQVLDIGDVLVVRLAIPPGGGMNTNVFGISSEDGRQLWQVPNKRLVYGDSPYTGMRRVGGVVALYNWDGLELRVNPRTGEVLCEQHGR